MQGTEQNIKDKSEYSMNERLKLPPEFFKGDFTERRCNVRRNGWATPENKRSWNLELQASRTIDSKLTCHTHHLHSMTPCSPFSPNRPQVLGKDFKSDPDLDCGIARERLSAGIM